MNAGGRLPMLDPELVWAAVYQTAAPLKNIIVVSVTRKDGMSNTIVQTPLRTPIRRRSQQSPR